MNDTDLNRAALFCLPDPLRFVAVTAAQIEAPDGFTVLATPVADVWGRSVRYPLCVYAQGERIEIHRFTDGTPRWSVGPFGGKGGTDSFDTAQEAVDFVASTLGESNDMRDI